MTERIDDPDDGRLADYRNVPDSLNVATSAAIALYELACADAGARGGRR